MSTNSLPDVAAAQAHILQTVHSDAFFNRLAQYGHMPQTEKQAADLLQLGFKLAAVSEEPTVKQAEEAQDFYAQANLGLDAALHQTGLATKQASDDEYLRVAAAYAQDPSIYTSALAIKAAQAAALSEAE